MIEHILILGMVAGGGSSLGATSQAILFPSQVACETAKKQVEEAFSGPTFGYFRGAKGVCVPRHVDPRRRA